MELLNTHPIKKSDLGFHGNLFGGKLLAWIDAAAAGYSMQLCDTPRMVTVSIDKCFFEKPAKEGQLIKIYGSPSKLGTTSITLYMEARAHNVYTGNQTVILKTNIKFVCIVILEQSQSKCIHFNIIYKYKILLKYFLNNSKISCN